MAVSSMLALQENLWLLSNKSYTLPISQLSKTEQSKRTPVPWLLGRECSGGLLELLFYDCSTTVFMRVSILVQYSNVALSMY